jgi:hypothetical protein
LALLAGSPWDPFSSESARPVPLTNSNASGQAGTGVLSVTGYVGVPSRSGIPIEGGSCASIVGRTIPLARTLAAARATLLAQDLGMTLGVLDAEAASKWTTPDSPFPSGSFRGGPTLDVGRRARKP